MTLKILHLSDIHLGSGFSHGRTNPETGLNTRLEDFVSTLSRCMDAAIEQSVDLVLFGGDAFPDATPPPIVQQAFAQQFRRLVDAQIPTVLLVGNHDQHSHGMGGASLCIYRTLGIPGFVVGDKLETHPIQTASGPVQVVTLPWLTRSTLLTRPETEGLSMGDVGELLLDRLRVALEAEIRQLDSAVPAILLAHVMTDTARFGAERFLAVGKGFTVPMSLLARPCFDYVALGHVHKHQVICQNPLMVYPGSIERVDFSEEKEDKGYVMLSLDKGKAEMSFCPLPARPFRTISVDLTKADEPNEKLLKAIAKAATTDTVVRLLYKLRADQIDSLDNAALHKALAAAHTYTIHPELVSQLSRPRLPELGADNSLEPVTALQAYLANREDLKDIASDMIAAAEALLQQEPAGLLEPLADEDLASIEEEDENRQLRLL
ncbi:MAG: exonuclease subunit SbcD [Cyanobacteria bacterium J06626_23]